MNNQIAIINPKWEDYILRAELMSCRPMITTITKHCSTGKTESFVDWSNIFPAWREDIKNRMLSDINKKRTPDYVLESLEGIKS